MAIVLGPKNRKGDKGEQGERGPKGPKGDQGEAGKDGLRGPSGMRGSDGQGVPTGGTAGQVLSKIDSTDYNTQWVNQSGGGTVPYASVIGEYKIDANTVGGDPSAGYVRYNNATQISATNLTIDHISSAGVDIDIFLSLLTVENVFIVQDKNDSANFQIWTISSAPIHSGATYWTIPVTLNSSAGTGSTGFPNNHEVFIAVFGAGGSVSDAAYGAGWDGDTTTAPSKNAVYDQIQSMTDLVSFTQFGGF